MIRRRKMLFWFFLAAALAFLAVPSMVLLENLKALLGTAPEDAGLRRPILRAPEPRERGRGAEPVPAPPEPRFVRFTLKAPEAKAVFLAGDFNLWRSDRLALKAAGAGQWELLLPLPPGRHRYRFVVDGRELADPANPDSEKVGDEIVSVKTVQ